MDHELKVGDLIYSNGALASVDDNAPVSDDCVGVVYLLVIRCLLCYILLQKIMNLLILNVRMHYCVIIRAVPMDWFWG